MSPDDFEVLKAAIEVLQDTVEGNAQLNLQAMVRLDRRLGGIEKRLDEVDLVHENLIGEIRQLNKNLERIDNDRQ